MTKIRLAALSLVLAVGLWLPTAAQDSGQQELAENNPVAIISQLQGDVEVKHLNGDWRPGYWMDLLRPQDQVRTHENGKVVVNFFFDDHLEVVEPGTDADVAFKNLTRSSQEGKVRREEARDRTRATIDIPYMFMRKLKAKEFELAQEPGAMEKENHFLKASVTNWAYPPVFEWGALPDTPHYRIQLFNEWDEFLYEANSKVVRWKFPYKAPFSLAKAGLYQWQVLTPGDEIVVRKYKFYVLTQLQAREVEAWHKKMASLKLQKKATRVNYTDLFLVYNRLKMVDEKLRLLLEMSQMDPENPILYRGLVRAYLDKGCPAHATEALNRELQLGGFDDIEN